MVQQSRQSQQGVESRRIAGQRSRYLILRVTGVMLAVLVLGHFALTHIVHDVAETDSSFIVERWSSVLWVGWDGLMLGAAFAHAAAGITVVIRDVQTNHGARRIWLAAVLGVSLLLLILGTMTLTFGALG